MSLVTLNRDDVTWIWDRFQGGNFSDVASLWDAMTERSRDAGHGKGALPNVSAKVVGLFLGGCLAFVGWVAFILFAISLRASAAALALSFTLLGSLAALGIYLRIKKPDQLLLASICVAAASIVLFALGVEFTVLRLVLPTQISMIWWPAVNLVVAGVAAFFFRHPVMALVVYTYADILALGSCAAFSVNTNTISFVCLAIGVALLVAGWLLDRYDHESFASVSFVVGLINVCSSLSVLFSSMPATVSLVAPFLSVAFFSAGWLTGYVAFHLAAAWGIAFLVFTYARSMSGLLLGIILVAAALIILAGTLILSRYHDSITRALVRVLPPWAFTPRMRRHLEYDSLVDVSAPQ